MMRIWAEIGYSRGMRDPGVQDSTVVLNVEKLEQVSVSGCGLLERGGPWKQEVSHTLGEDIKVLGLLRGILRKRYLSVEAKMGFVKC